jgi:hypothetical protein
MPQHFNGIFCHMTFQASIQYHPLNIDTRDLLENNPNPNPNPNQKRQELRFSHISEFRLHSFLLIKSDQRNPQQKQRQRSRQ